MTKITIIARLILSSLLCLGIFQCSPEREPLIKSVATAQQLASDEDFEEILNLSDQLIYIAAKRIFDLGSLEKANENIQEVDKYLKSGLDEKGIPTLHAKMRVDVDVLEKINIEIKQRKENLAERYVNIEKIDPKIILEAIKIRAKLDNIGSNLRGFDSQFSGMCWDCIANNCSMCSGGSGSGGGGSGAENSLDPGSNYGKKQQRFNECLYQRAVIKSIAYAQLRNKTAGAVMGCAATGVGTGIAVIEASGILALIPGIQEIPAVAALIASGTVSTICISWVLQGLASEVLMIEMEYRNSVNDCYSRWQ